MSGRSRRKITLLDLAVERFPQYTRDELFARILCGEIAVDGGQIRDPKHATHREARLELNGPAYVGRGGDKLAGAWQAWSFPVESLVFVDAGASTGGFTDFLLQHGAAAVHTVDVGYNQLDYSLRRDPRVHVHERTNIMSVTDLSPRPDAAVGDLSFRSLRGAVVHILGLTALGWGVFLLKPQFELESAPPNFSGVVTDGGDARRAVETTLTGLAGEGVRCADALPSTVRGRKGNQEYLVRLILAREEDPGLLEREARGICGRLFTAGG